MEKTPQYPMSTPPKRRGMYECGSCGKLHKWDGRNWHIENDKFAPSHWYVANSTWRGLVRPNA